MRGIVLFVHGSRDPQWAKPFEMIRDRVRASRPEYPICLAYLEMMSPTLEEAIATVCAEGASSVRVYPLFLAQGGHLKQDVPRILDEIRTRYPNTPIALEPALGEVPELMEAITSWILERAQ
jgi:sirohydrochlorin cobaltochelatase